jgi:deoxyadenosine/deoxycytidine kinase
LIFIDKIRLYTYHIAWDVIPVSFILSLQGGIASGKTTTAHYIGIHLPDVTVSYENPSPVLAAVRAEGLSKFILGDYIQIQRLFIKAEVERYKNLRVKGKAVLDAGPEETEFYTLHFPQSIGMDWDIERALAPELDELRKCMPEGILFLDARNETLRRRSEADTRRSRSSFDHYIMHMHRRKKEWFLRSLSTTFLQVDGKTEEEVGKAAVKWVKSFDL